MGRTLAPAGGLGRHDHVRYADEIIVGFQYEIDARRFWDAMRERLAEYSLSLHLEKTRLIEFGRFAADQRARCRLGKPETFNFLGFTFICGRSRRERFALKRKSRGDRIRAKLQESKKERRGRGGGWTSAGRLDRPGGWR